MGHPIFCMHVKLVSNCGDWSGAYETVSMWLLVLFYRLGLLINRLNYHVKWARTRSSELPKWFSKKNASPNWIKNERLCAFDDRYIYLEGSLVDSSRQPSRFLRHPWPGGGGARAEGHINFLAIGASVAGGDRRTPGVTAACVASKFHSFRVLCGPIPFVVVIS